MELILWRHAEAADGPIDLSRPLTKHGLQQAKAMADWLKPQLPKDVDILVSPALRTLQTVEALDLPYTIVPTLQPGADANEILHTIEWPQSQKTLLLVGHQPWLGMLAATAMTGNPQLWSVKKGAVWWISSRIRSGEQQSLLKFSIAPDRLFQSPRE